MFCAHHRDAYPAGNSELGPATSLAGRNLGSDFTIRDGWRMYHGNTIPGFPAHPHRGFETVTIVQKGFVDHSDSYGATGRYGNGDVQWMTAGSGLQHAEMFPLLSRDEANPLELFQVWLNLPASRKMCRPYYKMLWAEDIPVIGMTDSRGRHTCLRLIAGVAGEVQAVPPAPDSWAADPENEVAIWLVTMEAGATFELPPAPVNLSRTIYFYQGTSLYAGGSTLPEYYSADISPELKITLVNGPGEGRFLLLQGKPIHEPVAQAGPFVMNTDSEIREAFRDFRLTQFSGWPWKRPDPVHGREKARFARYADGREEHKTMEPTNREPT